MVLVISSFVRSGREENMFCFCYTFIHLFLLLFLSISCISLIVFNLVRFGEWMLLGLPYTESAEFPTLIVLSITRISLDGLPNV